MDIHSLLGPHVGLCWRVVETQEIAATRSITKSAEDQHRLEELLDMSKPSVPEDCSGLSYLLMTPFRYPPLNYGSRFGSTMERGIFYGSDDLKTAFAETAVYFWLFQSGPTALGPLDTIRDQRTAFSVRLASNHALDIETLKTFTEFEKLKDPASWHYSQSVGTKLREAGTEFFWYPSARIEGGKNLAVFSPQAFATPEPAQQLHWNVQLSKNSCWFGSQGYASYEYHRVQFEQEGAIPHPSL